MSDLSLQSALLTVICGLSVAYALFLALTRMRRTHPGIAIGLPIAIGFAARLGAVAAIDGTGLSRSLRGGDEVEFLSQAHELARISWSSPQWISQATHLLHVAVFAAQIRLLGSPAAAQRVVQIGISMAGLLLLVLAVNQLAGPRAARLAAWILMLEPAGIFFDSALHKEPLMLLASGVVVYGCVRIWRALDLAGIVIAGAGGGIAVMTRGYAGYFLVSATVLLILNAAVRRRDRPLRALPLIYLVAIGGFLVAPTLLQLSSKESLATLQGSQNANTNAAATSGANGNNLALERVDFSTRGKILTNLPKRVRDLLLKPYPWQVANTSEILGALGSLVALTGLYLLLRYAWLARRSLVALSAPIFYPLFFLLSAYALSAGNAGTGFRYRTHIITLAFALLAVLRTEVLEKPIRLPSGVRRLETPIERPSPVQARPIA